MAQSDPECLPGCGNKINTTAGPSDVVSSDTRREAIFDSSTGGGTGNYRTEKRISGSATLEMLFDNHLSVSPFHNDLKFKGTLIKQMWNLPMHQKIMQ